MTLSGHCLCTSVRFVLDGPQNWVGNCYCYSCRRNAGAPVVTFIGQPNGHWRWTGQPPACHVSSPGNRRYFCSTCGSSVAYASDRYPDEMHFHATLLDDPSQVIPSSVYHLNEKLPWGDL